MVVLDTDHLTLLEYHASSESEALRTALSGLTENEVGTTIVNYEEQMRGWLSLIAKSRKLSQQVEAYHRMKRQLKSFCRIIVLDFDDRAASVFTQLEGLKLRVATMDMRIAAIAIANDALLLTRNSKDFRRIPDLRVEDWTV